MLSILKLMLHVQHRVWLLGAFVLFSEKHMQPTSFVLQTWLDRFKSLRTTIVFVLLSVRRVGASYVSMYQSKQLVSLRNHILHYSL